MCEYIKKDAVQNLLNIVLDLNEDDPIIIGTIKAIKCGVNALVAEDVVSADYHEKCIRELEAEAQVLKSMYREVGNG